MPAGLKGSADLIVVDIFAGSRTPAHVTSLEFHQLIATYLAPGGTVLMNIADGQGLVFAKSQLATIAAVHEQVWAIAAASLLKGRTFGKAERPKIVVTRWMPEPAVDALREAGEVLAFERVGIARYARCERLLRAAPEVLGAQWDSMPAELRARWVRALTRARRARLLAYQVVSMQSAGRVSPGDAAAYRIAVTRLDQESAGVLTELAGFVADDGAPQRRFRRAVDDHWRYANAATVASGSIEIQQILLARAMLGRSRRPPGAAA